MNILKKFYRRISIHLTERGHPDYYYSLRMFGYSREWTESFLEYWGNRGVEIARETREKLKTPEGREKLFNIYPELRTKLSHVSLE